MAFDTFMYFTGGTPAIKGETQDTTYKSKNAMEIYSFSLGASNPVTIGSAQGGMGAGKVSLSSFNFMKKTDTASPTMFQACAMGTHYPNVQVDLRKAGGTKPVVYLSYIFTECMIESIQWSGSSGGDDTPTESVSMAYGELTINYTPQNADGTQGTMVPAKWNQVTNTAT
jgi:type VI secretion system secreted protein Hcp